MHRMNQLTGCYCRDDRVLVFILPPGSRTQSFTAQGIVRRGFDFGTIDELKDQAKRGGVRLPGAHSVKMGHRCIYTDPGYNMADFLKPRNVIRVQGEKGEGVDAMHPAPLVRSRRLLA